MLKQNRSAKHQTETVATLPIRHMNTINDGVVMLVIKTG